MRVFHILVIPVALYLSIFGVKAFVVNAGYVKVSTSCTNTAIAEGLAVNQVLKCSNYFEKIGKYDSAFRVLFKCSTKNHVCLKQIGQLVFDHDIRHGFDLVISALEKVDQEQNSWVENMLGGLLVKRAVKSDILRARELFKKAYGRGSSTAVQNLAELEFILENYESSLFYLEKLRLLDLKRKSQE